jgi:hypothetical protein
VRIEENQVPKAIFYGLSPAGSYKKTKTWFFPL